MSEYSDNLTVADVEAVLDALPDHAITGNEIALIISEVVMRFCDSPLEAVAILGKAVTIIAADGADHGGRGGPMTAPGIAAIRAQYSDGEYLDAYPGEACVTILAICDEVDRLRGLVRSAAEIIHRADNTEGTYCCGESMMDHAEGMDCGHSPVDAGAYHAHRWQEEARAALGQEGDA